ncbi:MAG: DUF362 domain-containing protein [Candidatus Hodarchaeales archaeon]|jgi:uncharacterized Fe-S center protein
MSENKVFHVNTEQMGSRDSLIDRLERLWNHEDVGLKEWIKTGEKVILKTHFGSTNQTRHLRSMYIRKIVDLVRKAGGIPWVAECCGLGLEVGNDGKTMTTGPGYQSLAADHGFTSGSMNAPVVILDGVWGSETTLVDNYTGKYLNKIALATGLRAADKILVVSRFKGHDGAGFGGALKQLGIGMVGKQGKGEAHFGGNENIYLKNPDNCNACGKCVDVCPPRCLSLVKGKIALDNESCIACIHCFSVCNADKPKLEDRVFRLHRQLKADESVERMMDNAGGVAKFLGKDRLRYINIAVDITSHCDCISVGGHPLVPDQGILYSEDPIAIDQACVDLVTKAQGLVGSPAEKGIHQGPPEGGIHIEANPAALEPSNEKLGLFSIWVQPELRSKIVDIQLSAAEAQGIGSRSYDLVDVTNVKKEKESK